MNEEYLKVRAESLKSPELKIKISDEDLLRKIIEYVEQSFLVFKKNYPKPINYNKTKSKVVRKKKPVRPIDFNEEFIKPLYMYNYGSEGDELFKFIIDMRGFNALPKIISNEEAKLIEDQGNVFYRGADKNEYYANLLAEKSNYHYGGGWHGHGIYASVSKSVSRSYSYKNQDGTFKFSLDGEGFSIEKLKRLMSLIISKNEEKIVELFASESKEKQNRLCLLYDAYHNLPEKIKNYVLKVVVRDLSLVAAFLGYDYLIYDEKFEDPETCILNRGAILVSESEFDRVTKGTKYERKINGQLGE